MGVTLVLPGCYLVVSLVLPSTAKLNEKNQTIVPTFISNTQVTPQVPRC